MRLIHDVHFSPQEFEFYRQLVFNNITQGMKQLLETLPYLDLEIPQELEPDAALLEDPPDVKDGQPFPATYLEPLRRLWHNETVQKGWLDGKAAVPDKCARSPFIDPCPADWCTSSRSLSYFYNDLERLFQSDFYPTEQDIIRCKARTVGITETIFKLRQHEMLMVDVGGQKSERRKWIHCFQEVTTILFLVSLSGYDQSLVEDKDSVSHFGRDGTCHAHLEHRIRCKTPWPFGTQYVTRSGSKQLRLWAGLISIIWSHASCWWQLRFYSWIRTTSSPRRSNTPTSRIHFRWDWLADWQERINDRLISSRVLKRIMRVSPEMLS